MTSRFVLSVGAVFACAMAIGDSACIEVDDFEEGESQSALGVSSLQLSPSTIAGGTGGSSQATVTLAQPAPAGGALVALSSSNTELAASAPVVRVPQGATSATFAVATNARFRRYSGLAFSAVITASIDGTSASATLSVTAQARPPDITSDSTQRRGSVCGGRFPAGFGDHGVLFTCQIGPNPGTAGTCAFREECLLGCRTVPADGFDFFDVCATSGPYPVSVSPRFLVGGTPATGTLHFPAAVPANTQAFVLSDSQNATAYPSGFFPVPTGVTTQSFTVATSIVPAVNFVRVSNSFEIPQPLEGGGVFMSNRLGLVWLAVAPPENPPAQPQPVLGQVTVDPASVTGGNSAFGTAWLSSVIPAGSSSVTVSLSSSHPALASVPPSVTIDVGSNTANFTVSTATPAASTLVTITGSAGAITVTDTLTVNPASCVPTTCAAQGANCGSLGDGCGGTLSCGTCTAPQTCGGGGTPNVCGGGAGGAALTVTATGRGGERVRSSPAGIDVAVGSTGSATFGTGTSITLSATNNRDVVWSGACSSSGARRKTCTFVLNANSAITADVR